MLSEKVLPNNFGLETLIFWIVGLLSDNPISSGSVLGVLEELLRLELFLKKQLNLVMFW